MDTSRLEDLIDALRRHGGRVTTARRALVTALIRADGHLTADDLAAAVQRDHPDIHLSTIYRTLDALEKMGLVDHVHLGHGRAVYHLADDPHQHLVCEECGAVLEVPPSTFEELGSQLHREYGFAIRPHHFAVLGRCSRCNVATWPRVNSEQDNCQ